MDVQAIRDLIGRVKELEAQSRHLQKLMGDQIEQIHHTIELPEENACETLLIFTIDYIDHVPDFLEALNEASQEAGIHSFIAPFLDYCRRKLHLSCDSEPAFKWTRLITR